jgi:uncharacterized membrane protein
MTKGRLEAFSDGVFAVIITIMVLELKAPHGTDWEAVRPVLPAFLTYVLSYVFLGIYWNNHHHMLHAAHKVDGRILWANLHLLFWLSLIPFVTGWMGENHFTALPTALYGFILLMTSVAYWFLQCAIRSEQGRDSRIATALGWDWKGKLSPMLYLAAVPLDYAQIGAAVANYDAAREALERLKSFGINFVYTHNYDCMPGSHLSFAEILRAADDIGMLVAVSQPHFQHYDWEQPDADQNNGYARHAEFYVRVSQNHPAVVAYAMSHNATGYNEDMNPDMIDGIIDPRGEWERNSVKRPLRAEAIVKRLDPARIVYHHSSGNLSSMYTINFYPNFAPIQELSDWFEHWATNGVKPLFTCEYSAPANWDWGMYRGWYKGQREFGSGREGFHVPAHKNRATVKIKLPHGQRV